MNFAPIPVKKKKYKKRKIKEEKDLDLPTLNPDFSITCSTCGLKFPTVLDLTEHNQSEHQEDKDCYICPICNNFEARGENARKSIKGIY